MTEITAVRPEEYPEVVSVWEASVRATHHFLTEADIRFFKPLILHEYLHLVTLASIRDAAGNIAGFVGVAEAKVEMLFIHPAARGKGIGKKLLRYAVDGLKANQVDVNEQNEQAVGFYTHFGFSITGRSEVDGMGKPFPLLHMELYPTMSS